MRRKRLKSLDEFERPAGLGTGSGRRAWRIAFPILVLLALAAGTLLGLWLPGT